MIVVTTPLVDGKQTVTMLGLVRGNTVRARHVGRDFLAGPRNVVGGEVVQYSRLLPSPMSRLSAVWSSKPKAWEQMRW